MINIVIAPPSKLFAIPVLAILLHYKINYKERIYIVATGELSEILKNLGVDVLDDIDLIDVNNRHINIVAWQHNSRFSYDLLYNNFKKLNLKNNNRLLISIYPDGFGNTSWGDRLDLLLNEKTDQNISVRHVLTFGYLHSTTKNIAKDNFISIVDIEPLERFFRSNEVIDQIIENINYTIDSNNNFFVIPYRPWCTAKFHGGVYNFGTQNDLLRIYLDLIKFANKDNSNISILFRPDERFPDESNYIFKELSSEYLSFDMKKIYPQWLTLEPFISGIFRIKNLVNRTTFLTLDSTTFQYAPFLAQENGHLHGLIGAFRNSINVSYDGKRFIDDKLRGKVSDFASRFKYFKQIENASISEISWHDDTLFSIKT